MSRFRTIRPLLIALLLVTTVLTAGCSSRQAALVETEGITPSPAGRQAATETPSREPRVTGRQTAEPATATSEPTETVPLSSETEQPAQRRPIGDDEAMRLMSDLLFAADRAPAALQRIVEAGDARFTAVLIELLRGQQIGLVRSGLSPSELTNAIDSLNGQVPAENWFELIEWYGQTELNPPPGFTSWKGRMLSLIDPRFGVFLRDDHPSRIRIEEVQWGGVPVDGIPALDQPAMLTADQAEYLAPENVVFGLEVEGEARAYPKRLMDWHEMANDTIGGVPVSLAYCTLCGAAIAFDGRAADGNVYDFGSSGFLYRSNKLMYDRQTNTLWNQMTGEPVLGELADSNMQLRILPVVLTTWEEWRAAHPQTLVADINTGFERDYRPGAAYGDYFAYEDTMFPVWQRSDLLDAKEQIYAVRINDVPRAYPVDTLVAEKVVNDELGGQPIVLVAPGARIEVEGDSLRVGPVTYEVGGAIRAYERGPHTFSLGPDAGTLLDEQDRQWQVTESELIGPEGEALRRLGGHLAYWFGWFSFFPNTSVYGQ